jgi:hypothetical protein
MCGSILTAMPITICMVVAATDRFCHRAVEEQPDRASLTLGEAVRNAMPAGHSFSRIYHVALHKPITAVT